MTRDLGLTRLSARLALLLVLAEPAPPSSWLRANAPGSIARRSPCWLEPVRRVLRWPSCEAGRSRTSKPTARDESGPRRHQRCDTPSVR
jgi:hypothetical protein